MLLGWLLLYVSSTIALRTFKYEVVDTIYHDRSSFLEGFSFDIEGNVVESVGLTGQSKLLYYKRESANNILGSFVNSKGEFAEGIAFFQPGLGVFASSIILAQLTYLKHLIHFYEIKTFQNRTDIKLLDTANLPNVIKEGWGLTSTFDRRHLIMGDGSSVLYFLSVKRIAGNLQVQIEKAITVHDCLNKIGRLKGLNELEIIPEIIFPLPLEQPKLNALKHFDVVNSREIQASKSFLWSNIIGTWCIAIVDLAKDGEIYGYLDITNIDPDFDMFNKVANGIAYNYADGSLYLSGKKWKKSYRISLIETKPDSFDPKRQCITPWSVVASSYEANIC